MEKMKRGREDNLTILSIIDPNGEVELYTKDGLTNPSLDLMLLGVVVKSSLEANNPDSLAGVLAAFVSAVLHIAELNVGNGLIGDKSDEKGKRYIFPVKAFPNKSKKYLLILVDSDSLGIEGSKLAEKLTGIPIGKNVRARFNEFFGLNGIETDPTTGNVRLHVEPFYDMINSFFSEIDSKLSQIPENAGFSDRYKRAFYSYINESNLLNEVELEEVNKKLEGICSLRDLVVFSKALVEYAFCKGFLRDVSSVMQQVLYIGINDSDGNKKVVYSQLRGKLIQLCEAYANAVDSLGSRGFLENSRISSPVSPSDILHVYSVTVGENRYTIVSRGKLLQVASKLLAYAVDALNNGAKDVTKENLNKKIVKLIEGGSIFEKFSKACVERVY